MGSGCDSVGKAVASDSRGAWFKSSHQQKFILNIYCQLYWKDENKEKEAGNGPFLKKNLVVEVYTEPAYGHCAQTVWQLSNINRLESFVIVAKK